jgi:hypothetical protein
MLISFTSWKLISRMNHLFLQNLGWTPWAALRRRMGASDFRLQWWLNIVGVYPTGPSLCRNECQNNIYIYAMLYVWIVYLNKYITYYYIILPYITIIPIHTPEKNNKQLPHLASLTSDPWDPPNGDAGSELRASTAGATLDTVPGTHQRARWRTPETWRLHKRETLGNPILGALNPRAWRTLDGFSAHTCDACCFRKPVFEDNRSESLVLVFFGPVANKQKWATRTHQLQKTEPQASCSPTHTHVHTRTHTQLH